MSLETVFDGLTSSLKAVLTKANTKLSQRGGSRRSSASFPACKVSSSLLPSLEPNGLAEMPAAETHQWLPRLMPAECACSTIDTLPVSATARRCSCDPFFGYRKHLTTSTRSQIDDSTCISDKCLERNQHKNDRAYSTALASERNEGKQREHEGITDSSTWPSHGCPVRRQQGQSLALSRPSTAQSCFQPHLQALAIAACAATAHASTAGGHCISLTNRPDRKRISRDSREPLSLHPIPLFRRHPSLPHMKH